MFLARTDEQRRFEGSLTELMDAKPKAGPSPVLLVYGLGGMGKTELCRRFTAIAQGELPDLSFRPDRLLVVNVDWEDERSNHGADPVGFQPHEALAAIHDRTANHPDVWGNRRLRKRVAKALDPFLAVAHENTTIEQSLRPLSDGLTGNAGDGVDPGVAVTRAVQMIRASRSELEVKQAGLLGRTNESLVHEFAEGMRQVSRHHPIVVILDHYEIVVSCGGWLRQAMLATGPRVMWVVAARIEPEAEAGDRGEMASFRRQIPERSLQLIEMSPFGEATIGDELAQRGIADVDATMIDTVKTLTKGVPLAVSIVAGLLSEGEDLADIGRSVSEGGDTTKLVQRLAQRYLIHALEDPRLSADTPLLLDLALLYADRADAELLHALWGEDVNLDSTLTLLAERHDFVLTTSRRLHQEVRETFRRYLLDAMRRDERREANRRAAEVASRRIDDTLSGKIEERLEDEQWRLNVATFVWHRFWEDNDAGFDALCEFFPGAILLQRTFAYDLVSIAGFFKDTFSAEQLALHRGIASLLSFGGFIGSWLAKRRAFLLRGTVADSGSESAPGFDQGKALERLRSRADDSRLLDTKPLPRTLVDLLIAKCESKSNPAAALSTLTAAAGAIDPDDGDLAAEVAQTARDLADILVEPGHTGNFSAPTTEGMRAGELWAAYSGNRAAVMLWFGRSHRERGEIEEATRAFEQAEIELESVESPEARVELLDAKIARAIGLQGTDREAAQAAYDEVIERFGNDPDRGVGRSVGLARFNRIYPGNSAAPEECRQVFERYGSDPQPALRSLAIQALEKQTSLLDGESKAGVTEEMLKAIAEMSGDEAAPVRRAVAGACLNLGNRCDDDGEFEEAIDHYQRVLDELKEDGDEEGIEVKAKALFNAGLSLQHLDEAERAVGTWGSLLRTSWDGAEGEISRIKSRALLMQSKLLREAGEPFDLEQAHDEFRRLISRPDLLPETLAFYGSFLAEVAEDHERARRAFEKALEGDPGNEWCLTAYARLRFEEGEVKEGMELGERSLQSATAGMETVLEMSFCVSVAGPAEFRDSSLAEIRRCLDQGARCRDWGTRRLLERAAADHREDLEWLGVLAQVIVGEAPPSALEGWDSWPSEATAQESDLA